MEYNHVDTPKLNEYFKKIVVPEKENFELMYPEHYVFKEQGKSGTIYVADYNGITVIIKKINCKEDVILSKYMSDMNIGPQVYDYFKIKNNYYIVMEKFDSSVELWFKYNGHDTKKCKIVVEQMINILEEQIKSGLFCVDIRPYNYVIRYSDLVVKMIDFEKKNCNMSKQYDDFFIFMLVRLYLETYYLYLKRENNKIRFIKIHKKLNNIDFKKLTDYYSKTRTDHEISELLEPFYKKFKQYRVSVKILKNYVISRSAWLIRSPKNYYEIIDFYNIKNLCGIEKANNDMKPENLFEYLFNKYKNKPRIFGRRSRKRKSN